MKQQVLRVIHSFKCPVIVILFLVALGLRAEEVFVTSYKGTTATTDVVPCPPDGGSCGYNVSLFGSSASSSAVPIPVIPASGRRIIYGTTNDPSTRWEVTPGDHAYLGTTAGASQFTGLNNVPGIYKMYITRGAGTITHSTNLVMSVTVSGSNSLSDTNGVGHSSLPVPFTRSSVVDQWIFIGYLTNVEASPTVTFGYLSGTVDSVNNRWSMDAVRFEGLCCCPNVPEVDPVGPLVAGQNSVTVTGVTNGATNVVVYANGTIIGQTNYPPGFSSGTLVVSTTPLVKDDVLTALQKKNGCFSFLPGSGPMVGGGANPKIKAFISCYKNASFLRTRIPRARKPAVSLNRKAGQRIV